MFDTGQGRKTDPVDAHSVAVAGLRSRGLRQVHIDDTTLALRLMVDRRAELGRARTEVVNRIHRMLIELVQVAMFDGWVRRGGRCAQRAPATCSGCVEG